MIRDALLRWMGPKYCWLPSLEETKLHVYVSSEFHFPATSYSKIASVFEATIYFNVNFMNARATFLLIFSLCPLQSSDQC